jgi:hypothetical protein
LHPFRAVQLGHYNCLLAVKVPIKYSCTVSHAQPD